MRSFGLDISDSVIRLAMLEKHGRNYSLPIRGEIAVPEGVIVDGDIVQKDAAVDLIRKLLAAARPKTKFAVVSLPERHGFIKTVTLDTNQNADEATVKNIIEPNLPYAWDEVNYDWTVLEGQAKDKKRILFSASPKETVNIYLDVLSRAGVDVVGLEIESLAIARAVCPPDMNGANIVLDLGRTRASLILVVDGAVCFSTTIRYAGKDLDQYIADALRISVAQAQKAKEMFGLDPEKGKGLLAKVLAPQLDNLAEKVGSIRDFYADHISSGDSLKAILLNGRGALIRCLDTELSARLDIPVVVQPGWVVKLATDKSAEIPEVSFAYTTAIGLSLAAFINRL